MTKSRREILLAIKDAVDGLEVTIRGEVRTIKTTDTLIDPSRESELPIFSITPGPETGITGTYGMSLEETMKVDMFGYTDGGSFIDLEEDRKSLLAKASEDIIEVIKRKLISTAFLDTVMCDFSIISIGPILTEHAELEDAYSYISIPLTVQYIFT